MFEHPLRFPGLNFVAAIVGCCLVMGRITASAVEPPDTVPPNTVPPATVPPATVPADGATTANTFAAEVRPLLARYCYECHGPTKPEGDLNLSRFEDDAAMLSDRRTWQRVVEVIDSREMPPETAKLPTADERERLTTTLRRLVRQPEADGVRNPGHVVLRRLNQVEYNNTMYDLFRIFKPRGYFNPADGRLPDSIRLVLHRNQRPVLVTLPPDDVGYGYDNIGEILSLPPFLMEKYFAAARQVVDLAAEQGRAVFAVRGGSGLRDRESARDLLASFTSRAFRRPTTADEVQRYLAPFDLAISKGETFEGAMKVALAAVLVSPEFLFRIELGSPPTDDSGIVSLTDYELASRLSYFLWSSMPDDELTSLAAVGKLRDPDVLEAQARRMLRSPKAKELAENFALQWLQVSNIAGAMPDPDKFPAYYKLRYGGEALRQEALLLFEAVMIEDRSVLDLVDAPFAYLNESLARYYGLEPQLTGQNASLYWQRYELTDRRRGGALTLGAVLTATSNSSRTSPVKRGKWILETLLGSPPPPPLANVPDLDETPAAAASASLRERLEAHRADPNCASCHRRMDPLGFGLEHFDAVGQWRERDGKLPIDARGTLVDGHSFDGPIELKGVLLHQRRDDYLRCLTEHMLTYALGRKIEYFDAAAVDEIVGQLKDDEYRLSTLVTGIVRSYPFRHLKLPESSDDQAGRP